MLRGYVREGATQQIPPIVRLSGWDCNWCNSTDTARGRVSSCISTAGGRARSSLMSNGCAWGSSVNDELSDVYLPAGNLWLKEYAHGTRPHTNTRSPARVWASMIDTVARTSAGWGPKPAS